MPARTEYHFPAVVAVVVWLLTGPLLASGLAAQELPVKHTLSFPERQNQYVHVSLDLPVDGDEVEVIMPSWTPGSYVIRDFAANLERLAVTGVDGKALQSRKTAKNRWWIDTAGQQRVTIDYDVWAGELHVSSSWVETDFGLLNGAGIFLYSDQSRHRAQRVEVILPSGWEHVVSPMITGGSPTQFVAADYDELVDSPIVAGRLEQERFEVGGQGYSLVNIGSTGFWNNERAIADLSSLVRIQQSFWEINPFERDYLFFNLLLEYRGGLEHDYGTVMMSDRWLMRDRQAYIKWLALASHEFFHAWNVRRMRPRALSEYDYEREVYTRELWLAEGISSYYDNLLLFRAGLINVTEYFEMLATEFRNYETVPGRNVRSVELASFDSWIKHYVPDANSVNSTSSYYRRGGIIGFVADAAIRRQTDDEFSLDTVMRRMYRQYGPDGPGQGGYPPGAFESMVESIAGSEVREMLERLLRTPTDPDIDHALDWYGLTLDRAPLRTAAELSNQPLPAGLGMSWDTEGELLIIDQVVRGGAASAAGVIPGDELLAINGERVLPDTIVSRTGRLRVGDRVNLTLARHGKLLSIPLEVQHAIPDSYTIALKQDASRRDKARLENWLGIKLSFSP